MSEQERLPEQQVGTQSVQSPSQGTLARLLSGLTLTHLTLIVLVVVFVWQWLAAHTELDQTQLEVARRLSEVEANSKAGQILLAQNQELLRELGGRIALLENRYAETQNQRAALEALYRDMSSNRDQAALAEVEQMLLIAVQQLQLSANAKAALIAMQQAETRLQRMDREAHAGLRKRIVQDIGRLRAVPDIDVVSINLRLDGIVASLDSLMLVQDARILPQEQAVPAVAETGWWQRFWRELKQDAASLVRIENTGQQEMPLLSPTQSFFLRENLKLRLLSARMALQTRDEPGFRRELKTAQDWLKRHFDRKSEAVIQAVAALQQLQNTAIVADLPDISGSLEAVRNYRLAHDRGRQ